METPRNSPEAQKSPEQIKTDVTKVILNRKRELNDWMKITDEEVATVKDELKKALDIPATEKITVRANGHRGGVAIDVESATNPLRRYLRTGYRWGENAALDSVEINLRSGTRDASDRIDKMILESLKIPAEVKVDFTRTEKGDVTEHQVIHRESKAVLGTVEVNEKTATVSKSQRNGDAIEKVAPKSLKDCMAALAKDGRIRDIGMRKTVEDAIRKELNLPSGFANRGLLISGKQNGKNLDITIEDKESEQVIAELEYNTQFDEFSSQKMNKAIINRILKKD